MSEHPKAKPETQIKELNEYIKSRNITGYITIEEKEREISIIKNEEVLKELKKLDGCYVIQTNVPKEDLGTEKVHNRYKDLAKIEEHFRNFKTISLEIRPIYHRKAERTQALVFITMLARMITRLFEEKTTSLNYSLDYMIKTLDRIQYNILDIKGEKTKIIPKILDENKKTILESLNIKLPQAL
jgi:transposase